MAILDEDDQLPDLLQQPLTAMRLMVEGAARDAMVLDADILAKVRSCLSEMQSILDAVGQLRES